MKRFIAILLAGLAASQAMAMTTSQVLDIYAGLTGRTILRPTGIPELPASLALPDLADTNRAIVFIEDQLQKLHLNVVRDGKKFTWILPEDWRNSALAAQLDRLQPVPKNDSTTSGYSFNFQGVDLNPALDLYASLRERTILRSLTTSSRISFTTQSPLTWNEAVHAFDVILAMNGVATVDDGDKFVQVVSLDRVTQVQTNAPKSEPGAPLIEPQQIKKSLVDTNASVMFHLPGMPEATPPTTAYRLVEYYAELNNQKAQPPKQSFQIPIIFEAVTPLSKPELLYAITTILELNNLVIVPVDHDTITLTARKN